MRKARTPKLRYALSLRRWCPRSDGVGAQAASADAGSERASRHRHAAHLQVGLKPPVDPVLGVTDVVSVVRLLAAKRATLGHESPSDGELVDKEERSTSGELTWNVAELYLGLSLARKAPQRLGR